MKPLILYAELAAWIMRAAVFSLWLAGMLAGDALNTSPAGVINGFWKRYLLIIIGSLAINLIISGKPKLRASQKPSNLILLDQFQISSFSTLVFLLQGTKAKGIIRNIAFLSGIKRVSNTADGSVLFIESIGLPNLRDRLITVGTLIIVLITLLLAPAFVFALLHYMEYLLIYINKPTSIAGDVLKYFSMTITIHYLFPYVTTSRGYLQSSVRYFAKYITSRYGYSVFTSSLIPFIRPGYRYTGLSDPKGCIYINLKDIGNNNSIFNYVVAHEAGHLSDKYYSVARRILSPLLFPFAVFAFLIVGAYFNSIGNFHFGNLFKTIGIVIIILAIIYRLKLIKESEYRADDFAVQKLGSKSVTIALEELSYKNRVSENMHVGLSTFLSGSISFNERLERIKKK